MKDYIIWLKSGETISGVAEERIIKQLQSEFAKDCEEKAIFVDQDGEVVIDLNQVEAIAINKQPDANKLGF